MTGLHSLRTLFLSCEHFEAVLPKLWLKELPRLRHVRLDNVFPAELSLPPGCRLDIHGEAIFMDQVHFPSCEAIGLIADKSVPTHNMFC